ncbi:MAG: hypothetical protein P1V97_17900, partial [Planctomycetota bacterium]|nr:hypothetical protein [Planctomycetota bacterium]
RGPEQPRLRSYKCTAVAHFVGNCRTLHRDDPAGRQRAQSVKIVSAAARDGNVLAAGNAFNL